MHSPDSIRVVESYLNKCLNVENGRCNLAWKHDDCKVLMAILYEMTEDDRYVDDEWIFDPGKKLLWE